MPGTMKLYRLECKLGAARVSLSTADLSGLISAADRIAVQSAGSLKGYSE